LIRGFASGLVCFISLSIYWIYIIVINLYFGPIDFGFWIPIFSVFLLVSVFTGYCFAYGSNRLKVTSIITTIMIFFLSVFYVSILPIIFYVIRGD
jgi:hypothetical protein